MKRWATLTVLLYLLILVALTVPVVLFGNIKWLAKGTESWWATDGRFGDALSMYREWGYWVWAGVMVLGQALLLFVPLRGAERRPTPRRHLLVPVITTAFLFANLLFAGVCSILVVANNETPFKLFEEMVKGAEKVALQIPVWKNFFATFSSGDLDGIFYLAHFLGVIVLFWTGWAVLFHRFSKTTDPGALTRRLTQWLMRGSILELLIAVPSHILVRRREDCCAPVATFWGMVTGLSIMLLAFGPGIFFLFVERMKRLRK